MENLNKWWEYLPVCINNAFGDPLTKSQIDNTIFKLNCLENHKMAYSIITKAVIDDDIFNKLKNVKKSKNLVVMYSLTGLDEGGFTFNQRVETINKLKELFENIIILVRPIIKDRNDDMETLEKIVKVAKNTSGRLITGAVHNEFKRKSVKNDVREMLIRLCEENGVKYFHKSSCAAADITNNKCWMHNLGKPENLDVVRSLGYKFEILNGKIYLEEATVGDLNFLRMITKSYVYSKKILSGYNLLSIGNEDDGHIYEVSSSWFSWSVNTACSINCDYCIINSIEYLDKKCEIGVIPSDIEKRFKVANKNRFIADKFSKGKFVSKSIEEQCIGYNDLRTTQICMANK